MSRQQLEGDLPEPVRRYFSAVADMEPPRELLHSAVAEIERSPRSNRFALPVLGFAAAVAVVLAAVIYNVVLPGTPTGVDPGSGATPSPSPVLIAGVSSSNTTLVRSNSKPAEWVPA